MAMRERPRGDIEYRGPSKVVPYLVVVAGLAIVGGLFIGAVGGLL